MFCTYVEGYTSEARYCPFCGSHISTHGADGSSQCDECGKVVFVIERE